MLFIFVNTYVFHHFCIIDSKYLSQFGKYQKKNYLPSPKQLVSDILHHFSSLSYF